MVDHPIASRIVPSTLVHRCESRNMPHFHTTKTRDIKRRSTTPVSHRAQCKLLMLTQSVASPQPEHWRLIKQTVGQLSLTASVADIDVAKAAATASTKGKRIVREDVTTSSDKYEGKALHLYALTLLFMAMCENHVYQKYPSELMYLQFQQIAI
ncbi:hypothetical protein CY34DRAFT_541846 [Suillus luteus UH-Slu-Lm8-n1]|uniref:Uncharacterized protein n=1 Tax=Suillus luteus UH-Slu-Lm8-n1 TaxID=930992 RepID=A0A0D0B680_9AGAM|nr:hypothetical protein CY34DRAFT_541846 [Suillus luteus UH-Slu-Lm8-n1]